MLISSLHIRRLLFILVCYGIYSLTFHFSLFSAELLVLVLLFWLYFSRHVINTFPAEHAENRRILMKDFIEEEFLDREVIHSHEYILNSKNNLIFTRMWKSSDPKHSPRAIILFLHGYGASSGHFTHIYANRFVKSGYLFASLDHHAHGRSDGKLCFIPNFNRLIEDAHLVATNLRKLYPTLKIFTFSESMGGNIALNLCLRFPQFYAGQVLLAPMCKISDAMKPPAFIIALLTFVARFVPEYPLAVTKNVTRSAFKRQEVIEKLWQLAGECRYERLPRLGTAVTMLRATEELEKQFEKIKIPTLVLHGSSDVVTDPECSRLLVERASARDKQLILVKDAWHVLLIGEPEEVAEKVYEDIFNWLDKRV